MVINMNEIKKEIQILRNLAYQYKEIAYNPVIQGNVTLHKAVVDLHIIRPVVLMDELPWHEMNFDGSLTLECEDKDFREVERYFRKKIFQYKYLSADMVLPPYYGIKKLIHHSGIGVVVEDKTIKDNPENNISAHNYIDQLSSWDDLEKLKEPKITYLKEETMALYNKVANVFGDILPIKLVGHSCHIGIWDDISMYRGVTPLLYDLYDEPEFTHEMTKRLFSFRNSQFEQMEKLNLLELSPYDIHCTPSLSDELGADYDGGTVLRKHVWGRGVAQIFSSVSKDMRDEFDISYMKDVMEPFGMVYYGCCEPLDNMIDIVEKIPNLRKISITPWANVNNAAEQIKGKYVLANKPNPAAVSLDLDEGALKKEIGNILETSSQNGCHLEIVLKDVSTCHNNIQNLIKWHDIVMGMVKGY